MNIIQTVPLEDSTPHTLFEMLDDTVMRYGGRVAASFYGKTMSFNELAALSDRIAKGLQDRGLRPGEHVALYMPNCLHWQAYYYGILKAGGVAVMINSRVDVEKVKETAAFSDSRFLITVDHPKFLPKAQEVMADQNSVTDYLIVAPMRDMVSLSKIFTTLAAPLINLLSPFRRSAAPHSKNHDAPFKPTLSLDDLRRQGCLVMAGDLTSNDGDYKYVNVNPKTWTTLIPTGGTTGGKLKLAIHTHKSLLATVELNRRKFYHGHLGYGVERFLGALPFFHIFGLAITCLLGIRTGTEISMVPDPSNARDMLEIANARPPTVVLTVPSAFTEKDRIGPLISLAKKAIGQTKIFVMGGQSVSPSLKKFIRSLMSDHKYFENQTTEGCGSTEAGIFTCQSPDDADDGSVGAPYDPNNMKIIDHETGEILPPGVPGELCVRGDTVFEGYYKNPEETAKVLDAEGWYHTDDIVSMTDGKMHIIDRGSRMIKINGEKVYPAEAEKLIQKHPVVAGCAVIRTKRGRKEGRELKALVLLKSGETLLPRDLADFMHKKGMENFRIPSYIHMMPPGEQLPLTNTSKVDWHRLEEIEAEEVANLPPPQPASTSSPAPAAQ